jgi:hypothetical protein
VTAQRLIAVADYIDAVPGLAQQQRRQHLVDLVVVDHQHP